LILSWNFIYIFSRWVETVVATLRMRAWLLRAECVFLCFGV